MYSWTPADPGPGGGAFSGHPPPPSAPGQPGGAGAEGRAWGSAGGFASVAVCAPSATFHRNYSVDGTRSALARAVGRRGPIGGGRGG